MSPSLQTLTPFGSSSAEHISARLSRRLGEQVYVQQCGVSLTRWLDSPRVGTLSDDEGQQISEKLFAFVCTVGYDSLSTTADEDKVDHVESKQSNWMARLSVWEALLGPLPPLICAIRLLDHWPSSEQRSAGYVLYVTIALIASLSRSNLPLISAWHTLHTSLGGLLLLAVITITQTPVETTAASINSHPIDLLTGHFSTVLELITGGMHQGDPMSLLFATLVALLLLTYICMSFERVRGAYSGIPCIRVVLAINLSATAYLARFMGESLLLISVVHVLASCGCRIGRVFTSYSGASYRLVRLCVCVCSAALVVVGVGYTPLLSMTQIVLMIKLMEGVALVD